MIEFGKTLRTAREAKGLTIADIANRTHLMSAMVSDLENENFSRLPAPIYGRGFIKLYCGVVGLDPKPLIDEFMEIQSGNRQPAIRERTVTTEEPSAPEPKKEPVPEPEKESVPEPVKKSAPVEPNLFDLLGSGDAAQPEQVTAEEPPAKASFTLFSQPTPAPAEPEPAVPPPVFRELPSEPQAATPKKEPKFKDSLGPILSRYTSPLRERAAELPRFAPAIGRWCVVIGLLALLLWGVVAGIRALYRATGNRNRGPVAPTAVPTATVRPSVPAAVPASEQKAPAPAVKTGRKPIDVPPLYID